jgi:hypothetical protein
MHFILTSFEIGITETPVLKRVCYFSLLHANPMEHGSFHEAVCWYATQGISCIVSIVKVRYFVHKASHWTLPESDESIFFPLITILINIVACFLVT